MDGWTGWILRVNLTQGVTTKEALNGVFALESLGRAGLGASYIASSLVEKTTTDTNHIVTLMTGPLTGLLGPSTGRCTLSSGNRLNDFIRFDIGGGLGPELKMAGYDGLIIEGHSAVPVYLYVSGNRVELVSAEQLWGLEADKASTYLRKAGQTINKICCIGTDGEQKCPSACITGDDAYIGGAGLGAVFGDRNLKGLAVHGTGPISTSDPEVYLQIALKIREDVSNHPAAVALGRGPETYKQLRKEIGSAVLRGFGEGMNHDITHNLKFPAEISFENDISNRRGCFSCPIGCRNIDSTGIESEVSFPAYVPAPGEKISEEQLLAFEAEAAFLEAAGFCRYCCDAIQIETALSLLKAATGVEFDEKSALKIGKRIISLTTRD